jgi:cytochrome c-type biogenesis protein CcmF
VIRSDLREDLYVVLASWDAAGNASFFMYVNPLVMWLWIGGVVLLLGGLVIIWPESSPVRSIAMSSAPTPVIRRTTAET